MSMQRTCLNCERAVREQVAREIEAERAQFMLATGATMTDTITETFTLCILTARGGAA